MEALIILRDDLNCEFGSKSDIILKRDVHDKIYFISSNYAAYGYCFIRCNAYFDHICQNMHWIDVN